MLRRVSGAVAVVLGCVTVGLFAHGLVDGDWRALGFGVFSFMLAGLAVLVALAPAALGAESEDAVMGKGSPLIQIVLVMFVVLAAPVVRSATIDLPEGAEFSVYDTGGVLAPGDTMTATGTFAPFDPSLGELVSVSVRFAGIGAASKTLSGLSPGEYSFGVFLTYELSASDGNILFSRSVGQGGGTASVLDDGSVLPAESGTGTPFEVEFFDGNRLDSVVKITDQLGYFVGVPGQFTAVGRWHLDIRPIADGLSPDSHAASFSVYRAIQYEYIPVPEVSTALLVGVGLALLAGARPGRHVAGHVKRPPCGH